jgi:hypothetical protein
MPTKKLLSPGTMVVCNTNLDIEQLVLWGSYEGDVENIEHAVHGTIDMKDVLIVIKSRINLDKNVIYSDEWKNGAYFVMSSSGMKGWVGEGWVVPVTI